MCEKVKWEQQNHLAWSNPFNQLLTLMDLNLNSSMFMKIAYDPPYWGMGEFSKDVQDVAAQ